MTAKEIFIVAGDLSGDMHAARLTEALKRRAPVQVRALGGPHLRASADNFLYDIVGKSAFGFWQPIKQYFSMKKVFTEILLKSWDEKKPDVVVVVDFYGFNIHVAKAAHERGIPVFYYVSPQVWASRPGRVRQLKRYVTKMLVILPFEEKLYRDAGVPVSFVGHPLIDTIPASAVVSDSARPVIGLFPGSRGNIFSRHLPILLETARIVRAARDVEFKLFCPYPAEMPAEIEGIRVVAGSDMHERSTLSLAVTTSGTVSLENALLGIPMIVFYRLSSFNYRLAKLLVTIPYITMANILAGKMIVPELLQSDAEPESIARTINDLMENPQKRASMRSELLLLREQLGAPGASERAAAEILT